MLNITDCEGNLLWFFQLAVLALWGLYQNWEWLDEKSQFPALPSGFN